MTSITKNVFFLILSLLIMIFFPACATKMSLVEAKKVSISMDGQSLVSPSRRINDILKVLDQAGQYDARTTERFAAQASKSPPDKADDKMMTSFYHERGLAAHQLGHMKQALDDLRSALACSEKAGISDPALYRHLGVAEKISGNFRKSVDLFEKALDIRDDIATYDQLIDAYIQMGDIETAKRLNRESIRAYDQKEKKKNAYRNAASRAAHMNRISYTILEAEGKHLEAERCVRRELELYRYEPDNNRPRAAIISRLNLSFNLMLQNRLIEAEIEARQAIRESLGLGGLILN